MSDTQDEYYNQDGYDDDPYPLAELQYPDPPNNQVGQDEHDRA